MWEPREPGVQQGLGLMAWVFRLACTVGVKSISPGEKGSVGTQVGHPCGQWCYGKPSG